jgi:hypothetical protein
MVKIEKIMVPPESAPQELSNEWSCQYVSAILNALGILCPALGDRSHRQSLKSLINSRLCQDMPSMNNLGFSKKVRQKYRNQVRKILVPLE